MVDLENVSVLKCYYLVGFGKIARKEIYAFSDAGEDTIRTAVCQHQVNDNGENHTALLFGQSRVTPVQVTSIAHQELCTAVLAAQAVEKITKEIPVDIKIEEVTFYSDSKVILGYIQNEPKILCLCRKPCPANLEDPDQWTYIDTNDKPPDLTMRPLSLKINFSLE